ncbi:MAG TPA: helix-turn-helix domain-containing protein [Streptosporangiaceae bacterium]|nr:helix-turn-helix domain-containing protein [Streptosporangiaceae bacterium]
MPVPADLQLLTTDDVATALGCSNSQARKLLASGEITSIKLGYLRRVTPAALAEYIASAKTFPRRSDPDAAAVTS